jgi:hypothetical protein
VLAESHVARGDLEQGLSVAREVISSASSGLRSARTISYVQGFIRRLSPYQDEPRVRAFVEETAQSLPLV